MTVLEDFNGRDKRELGTSDDRFKNGNEAGKTKLD